MFSTIQVIGIEIAPGLLLVQGLIFLIVVLLLNAVLFKPILSVLREREEKTEGFAHGAIEIERKAQGIFEQYKNEFRLARREALGIKKNYVAEAAHVREATLDGARKEASHALEEIRSKINQEVETARRTLHQEIESLGRTLAEKVLGRSI